MLKTTPNRKLSVGLLPLVLLLAARLALGVVYSLVTPVWEAYDEDGHFAYARYLAQHGHLLTPGDPEAERVWERFQPPLYYILIAPILAQFQLGDPFKPLALNPFFVNGDAGVNYALHPAQLTPEEAEIAKAVHAARLVGVLLTTLSVLFVYQAAGRLWPRQRAAVWTATLLYAFWPQLLFGGAVLSNDWLVTVFSAGIFDASVLLAAEGFRPGRALALAALLAAAIVTKINALALLPVAALALALGVAFMLRRTSWRSPRVWLPLLVLAGLVAGALAALRSLKFVTGQVLQLETLRQFVANLPGGDQATGLGPAGLRFALSYGFRTYLASFGWGNLETHPWVYWAWALAAAAGGVGLLVWFVRRPRGAMRPVLLALTGLQAASVLLASLFLVIAANNVYLLPGRYLLPSLPAVVCLLVEGWRALAGRARRWVWGAAAVGLALVAWLVPWQAIVPAYAQPRLGVVSVAELLGARFVAPDERLIELLGYAPPERVAPGGVAHVTLCWQAPQKLAGDYPVFLEVVGPDGQGYGRLATHPGHGNYPTSQWAAGVPFCEEYALKVGAEFPAPAVAQVRVALLATPDLNGAALRLFDSDGRPNGERAASLPLVVAAAEAAGPLARAADYRFGEALALTSYDVTLLPEQNAVRVDLRWESLRDQDANYTVFVHLRDTPNHAYAQADSEPRGGWYPTLVWRKGDVVIDSHVLPLPPGATPKLTLVIGVTASDTQVRLPVVGVDGGAVLDSQVVLERDLVFP